MLEVGKAEMLGASILAVGATITCLAQNIYFEARDQPTVGQMAVAYVVLNRVHHPAWPDTVCDVIREGPTYSWKQDYPIRNRCQFSWYCDGNADVIWANYEKTGQTIKGNARAWKESVELAIMIAGNTKLTVTDNTDGAVYYYAHNLVYPSWAKTKSYIGVLGNHTFMK